MGLVAVTVTPCFEKAFFVPRENKLQPIDLKDFLFFPSKINGQKLPTYQRILKIFDTPYFTLTL
jgi:hypothetical protein